ncbi:MAG: hypothetical protein CMB29_05025 [Euryarchaeota archaeon]|nr:hypothetical protein [Euryarchaeota archaeon]
MSENVLRRNCESCHEEMAVLDLCQEPDLVLCELCKPWVLDSIYQVPHSVIGIPIEDPTMFRLGLKLMEDFDEPQHEHDWLTLLCHVFSKKTYDEDIYVPRSGSKMVDDLRQDYANRWKIYDDEALDMFNQANPINVADSVAAKPTDSDLWSNDISSHSEFIAEIKNILTTYLDKRKENQKEQQELDARGWGDYLKHISWIDDEPIIYKINHEFELTTKQINQVLDWAEQHEISYDFVLQLFFDWATLHPNRDLDGLLYETNLYAPKIRLLACGVMPKSPEFCRQIYCLAKGYHGKNLQCLMLAAIHRWRRNLSPSHHFLVRDDQIWARSFQLLKSIIDSLGKRRAVIDIGVIKVKGDSGKWYSIQPATFKTFSQYWQVATLPEGKLICIDIQQQHEKMPIGDQLASVVLALANDRLMDREIHTLSPELIDD